LKISINYKPRKGSWGGGNQFTKSLVKAANDEGYKVVYDLKDKDIDIILMIDPRSYNREINFGSFDIFKYLLFVNENAIVVHRINECDERKNTKHMNFLLRLANYFADHNVFISSWLKSLNIYNKNNSSSVIMNGADEEIFNDFGNSEWNKEEKLRLVTHHWSGNKMKGFDIYKRIDNMLSHKKWSKRIEFTYIGNLPKNFNFKNSKHILPLNGKSLSRELSSHHIYVTASINEPAGMHHIEGILCGLPIVYKNSGALPEYCKEFGISFEDTDFVKALERMIDKYSYYKLKIKDYPNKSSKMIRSYIDLFKVLLKNKKYIVSNRNILRSPNYVFLNFIFYFLNLKKFLKKFKNNF
tara:strand:- start:6508 stop:7572 length:1065 start_codon:yes stop_codon:yes gene_type:complete